MRVIYIDIDSLRPDHLGCYGYHRNTSPTIDRLAEEGVLFEQTYTPDAPCLPSRTALYSGRFGIQTGVVGHGGTAGQPKVEGPGRNFRDHFDNGLAGELQRLGFHTTMISPFGQRHAAWHIYGGFNEVHNTGRGGMESAEEVQPVAEKWLTEHLEQDNWYLHLNYWDPHTPYRVPADYGDPFANEPLPAWLDDDEVIARHAAMAGPHSAMDIAMYSGNEYERFPRQPGEVKDRASMRRLIDGYDTAIKYVDDQLAKLIAMLKEAGIYEDTAIIVSADHGENMGELGIYAEHGTADVGTCRIPLIVKWPGGAEGVRNTKMHYNLDLVPTLMDLLGGQKQPIWDGQSCAPAITEGKNVGRDEVTISQCAHVCQRSIRWDNWIYLRTYHDGFHLFPQEMLFDLEQDPHEQNNLAASKPELSREGAWRLARWHDEQMQKMAVQHQDVTDPLWRVMQEGGPFHARLSDGRVPGSPADGVEGFDAYLKRLEETGRAEGAAALRERYAAAIDRWS